MLMYRLKKTLLGEVSDAKIVPENTSSRKTYEIEITDINMADFRYYGKCPKCERSLKYIYGQFETFCYHCGSKIIWKDYKNSKLIIDNYEVIYKTNRDMNKKIIIAAASMMDLFYSMDLFYYKHYNFSSKDIISVKKMWRVWWTMEGKR